jgi:hypothetical protein
MTTTNQTTEKASPIQRNYVTLGTDKDGASHVYRTIDETIFVVQDGEITHRIDVGDRLVEGFVDDLGRRFGQVGLDRLEGLPPTDLHYHARVHVIIDQLADALEAP